jgi:hypothetical protein
MSYYAMLRILASEGNADAAREYRGFRRHVACLHFQHHEDFRGRVFYAKHLKRADRAFHN